MVFRELWPRIKHRFANIHNPDAILLCMAVVLSCHRGQYVRTSTLLSFVAHVGPWTDVADASCRNWSTTMFFGVLLIAAIYYLLKGRHVYVGPVVNVKRNL